MNDNPLNLQQDTPFKDKAIIFYKKNKLYLFIALGIFITILFSTAIYSHFEKEKKITLGEMYIKAKIDLQNNKIEEANNILKEIIYSNDETYSALSLFLIVNKNSIDDNKELIALFDHIINNNKYDEEIKNLIIFKKALIQSDFLNEEVILNTLNPIIKSNSLWKPHALLLLGDYFFSKNEILKSKEFFIQVLKVADPNSSLYERASYQLVKISDD